MAHFVIGLLRNTSYYLFGSGSSGLGCPECCAYVKCLKWQSYLPGGNSWSSSFRQSHFQPPRGQHGQQLKGSPPAENDPTSAWEDVGSPWWRRPLQLESRH